MIKLLLLALLFFLGYSFFQALLPRRRDQKPPANRSQNGEQMVQDPQCGTYLPISEELSANIQGRQYYFCSRKCRKQYKKQT
jgi:YHS domain-containing protein